MTAFYAGFVTIWFIIYFLWSVKVNDEGWLMLFISMMGTTLIYSISALLKYFGCLGVL